MSNPPFPIPALTMYHGTHYCYKSGRWFGKREGPTNIPSWCPLPDAPENEDKEKEKT